MSKWIHSACQQCERTESISAEELNYEGDSPLTGVCPYCEGELCYECHLLHECSGHKPEGFYCYGCGEVFEWSEKRVHFSDGDTYCQDCVDKWEANKEVTQDESSN